MSVLVSTVEYVSFANTVHYPARHFVKNQTVLPYSLFPNFADPENSMQFPMN